MLFLNQETCQMYVVENLLLEVPLGLNYKGIGG